MCLRSLKGNEDPIALIPAASEATDCGAVCNFVSLQGKYGKVSG